MNIRMIGQLPRQRKQVRRLSETLFANDLNSTARLRQMSQSVAEINDRQFSSFLSRQFPKRIPPKVQMREWQTGQATPVT